jgi:hypothetical protein
MLALVVAAVGDLFVHTSVEPAGRSGPLLAPLVEIEFLQMLAALATIVACAVILQRFNAMSTLLNMLQHLVRYRKHD